jgi:hypothetical protein
VDLHRPRETLCRVVKRENKNKYRAGVSSGIYLYRLTAGKKMIQRKMVLLR